VLMQEGRGPRGRAPARCVSVSGGGGSRLLTRGQHRHPDATTLPHSLCYLPRTSQSRTSNLRNPQFQPRDRKGWRLLPLPYAGLGEAYWGASISYAMTRAGVTANARESWRHCLVRTPTTSRPVYFTLGMGDAGAG